jgi:hypothetical protein
VAGKEIEGREIRSQAERDRLNEVIRKSKRSVPLLTKARYPEIPGVSRPNFEAADRQDTGADPRQSVTIMNPNSACSRRNACRNASIVPSAAERLKNDATLNRELAAILGGCGAARR